MTSSSRGRPRDPVRHRAVLDATIAILVDEGYDQLTLTKVAARAGVGRPLLYQWWGSKGALVQEALFRPKAPLVRALPTGSGFEATFTALVAEMVDLHARPEYRAGLTGLIVDMLSDPDLLRETQERFIAPARARYEGVLDMGRREGLVRDDVDATTVLDILRGAAWFGTMLDPDVDTDRLVATLTELVLHGISPRTPTPTSTQTSAPPPTPDRTDNA